MGRNKLLLPFRQTSIIRYIVSEILKAASRLIVVTGRYADEVRSALEGFEGVEIVENPDWEKGMVGSAQTGIRALRPGEAGFFLHHGDMPFVDAGVFSSLAFASASRRESGLPELPLVASFGGRAGHPVYFPARLIPEILGLADGERLKSVIERAGRVLVETSCPGVLEDIDTQGDYDRLVAEDS